nr:retrotransposon protein, putative, Ty1-copia subclass [Tanacetum cinerariifolium]
MVPGLFYLEHERRIAYTLLDGHPVAGELNDSVEEKDSVGIFGIKDRDIKDVGKEGSVWQEEYRFKHKAFGKSKEWKQLVGNWTGRTVKNLRTDKHQNGLTERMNRTLNDKVRYLLIQSGLPKTLWVEATCMATYLINRSPSTAIEKKAPMEMWSGLSSGYDENFSCVTYSYVKEGDQEIDQTSDLTDYQLVQDREPRTRTKPLRFQNESNMAAYTFAAAEEEDTHKPLTYQEAVACEDNHPVRKKLVSYKWLFNIKKGIEGVQKPRYKARLVVRGFTQREGINYNNVFLLVVRHTSIRVILALTASKDYELEQLDIKTIFLHENHKEVIYMRQPSRYEQGNKRDGGGDGLLNWMSSGDIGERELVDGDVEEVGDLSLEAMKDKEVALVDGVFDGAFGALGDESGSSNGCHGRSGG